MLAHACKLAPVKPGASNDLMLNLAFPLYLVSPTAIIVWSAVTMVRGRRPNGALPETKALKQQRDFRAKRAEKMVCLSPGCTLLCYSVQVIDRPTLGRAGERQSDTARAEQGAARSEPTAWA